MKKRDPIAHLRRCIRRERRASRDVVNLTGWADMDGMELLESALSEAKRNTDEAVRAVAAHHTHSPRAGRKEG